LAVKRGVAGSKNKLDEQRLCPQPPDERSPWQGMPREGGFRRLADVAAP
jgi:hypothetical protein